MRNAAELSALYPDALKSYIAEEVGARNAEVVRGWTRE